MYGALVESVHTPNNRVRILFRESWIFGIVFDLELLKIVSPIVTGVLVFTGAVITFVHGRLNEADSDEKKQYILQVTRLWIAVGLWIVACVLPMFKTGLYAIPFFAGSWAIYYDLFVKGTSRPSRKEIAAFAVITALTAGQIVLVITFSLISQQTDLQKAIIEHQTQLSTTIEKIVDLEERDHDISPDDDEVIQHRQVPTK